MGNFSDNRLKDFLIYAGNDVTNVRTTHIINNTNLKIQAQPKTLIGISTGSCFKDDNTSDIWIEVSSNKTGTNLWVMRKYVDVKSNTTTDTDKTQKLLNEWILLEQKLFVKMQISYMYLLGLKAKGKNVNADLREIVRIWGNWKGRQNNLKSETTKFKISKNADFFDKLNSWSRVLNGGALPNDYAIISGLGNPVAIIIIVVIAIAATAATIAYIQGGFDTALKEYNACPELTAIFKKYNVPEAEQKTVLDAINKQYQDVQKDTHKKDWWKNLSSNVKILAFVTIGGLIVLKVTSSGKTTVIKENAK